MVLWGFLWVDALVILGFGALGVLWVVALVILGVVALGFSGGWCFGGFCGLVLW